MKASFILFTFALYLSLPAFSRPADGTCKDEAPMSGNPKAQIESLVTAAQMAENNDGMKAADAARAEEKELIADINAQIKEMDSLQERVGRGDDSNGLLTALGRTRDHMQEDLEKASKQLDLEYRLRALRAVKKSNNQRADDLRNTVAMKQFFGEE